MYPGGRILQAMDTLNKVLSILKREIKKWKVPAVGVIANQAVDRPFETLISTMLSLRTKDRVTETASRRLLARAPTPGAEDLEGKAQDVAQGQKKNRIKKDARYKITRYK